MSSRKKRLCGAGTLARLCISKPSAPIYSHEKKFARRRNKIPARWFTLMCVSEERPSAMSFEQLAMPLFDRLYNFAHWLTQNRDEAEDLVQETYVKALKGYSSFEPGTNFKAWMFRILRNTFLNSRTGLKAAHSALKADLQNATFQTHQPSGFRTRKGHCPEAGHAGQREPGVSLIGRPGRSSRIGRDHHPAATVVSFRNAEGPAHIG